MSWHSKIVWSEGMLLQPQHFQQHDRHLAARLEARVAPLQPYPWGFVRLQLDEAQLAFGRIALLACSGVLPDGTAFNLPADDPLPLPFDVPADAHDLRVVLALPLRRPGIAETDAGLLGEEERYARHRIEELEVADSNGLPGSAILQVGKLRLRLAAAQDVASAYAMLPVAQVVERQADGKLVLEADFCAPVLDYRAAPRLAQACDELLGLMRQRGEALAARLGQPGAAGAAEVADFLYLQLVNREEARLAHLANLPLHPVALYEALVALAGELAIFAPGARRPPAFPRYVHERLAECFLPVCAEVRRALSVVMDAHAVPIKLEERQFGLRVAVVKDSELVRSATFVLAVGADLPPEAIRSGFPPKVKIGAIEKIRDLVNLQLPGIGLLPLPVAPRQLPFHAGYTYFELERDSEYWTPLLNSAGFAMHVAGDFPGLKLEFWAIRK